MDAPGRTTDAFVRQRGAWGNGRFHANNYTWKELISVEKAHPLCKSLSEFSWCWSRGYSPTLESSSILVIRGQDAACLIHLPSFFFISTAQRLFYSVVTPQSDWKIAASLINPLNDCDFLFSGLQLFRVEVLFNERKHFVLRRKSEFQALHRKVCTEN